MSAGGQFLLAANGHFHVRQWAFFHVRRQLTERGSQIKTRTLTDSFGKIRDKAGLDSRLTPHCFRHSFISHMTEDGVDPKFLQEIAGRRFASTTGIYTHVSGEFMNTMLTNALQRVTTIGAANG